MCGVRACVRVREGARVQDAEKRTDKETDTRKFERKSARGVRGRERERASDPLSVGGIRGNEKRTGGGA